MTDSERTVDPETAEQEFERWIEAMDIDTDPASMDEDDKASFQNQKRVITRAMEYGRLIINEEGEAVFTPVSVDVDGGAITFAEPTGADKMAVDKHKQGQSVHQAYAAMGSVTKQPPKLFAKMKQRDLRVCEAVFALLFTG